VNISVLLGQITASFEDLLHLHQDDVLMLNTIVGRSLPVLVGECPKFQAQPGQSARHLAVQIMSVMEAKNNGSVSDYP
jgi:flagellar motor switch protein FliM